ncbi:hypothetical protein JCM10212_001599 [Sporobolomyces blumeae]
MFRQALSRLPTLRKSHARSASTSSYFAALRQRYPRADPPSLIAAFVVLHELTAVVPLSILFGAFHYLGIGASIVAWTLEGDESRVQRGYQDRVDGRWTRERARVLVREWVKEGEDKAERVGRRYGWFGWDKESTEERVARKANKAGGDATTTTEPLRPELSNERLSVTGDVANVAAAYLVVKALLPLRILVSLRLSPNLANVISKRFQGLRARGARMMKRNEPAP